MLIVSCKVDNFWVELKQRDYSIHTSSGVSVHYLAQLLFFDFSLLLLLTDKHDNKLVIGSTRGKCAFVFKYKEYKDLTNISVCILE